jgi:hypothetical protein
MPTRSLPLRDEGHQLRGKLSSAVMEWIPEDTSLVAESI